MGMLANILSTHIIRRKLKQYDSSFTALLFTTGSVYVYEWDDKWQRPSVFGSLFIYESGEKYKLMIPARDLDGENFSVTLDDFEVDCVRDLIILHIKDRKANNEMKIFGLWKNGIENVQKIYHVLER